MESSLRSSRYTTFPNTDVQTCGPHLGTEVRLLYIASFWGWGAGFGLIAELYKFLTKESGYCYQVPNPYICNHIIFLS